MSKKKKQSESAVDNTVSYAVNYTPTSKKKEALLAFIEGIQDSIRNLRDADSHVCPVDNRTTEDPDECTCAEYDKVLDRLEDAKDVFYA